MPTIGFLGGSTASTQSEWTAAFVQRLRPAVLAAKQGTSVIPIVLPRLNATPFGHFKEPVHLKNAAAEKLPRTYIRCVQWPNAVFDRYAETARQTAGWRYREFATSHISYITHPHQVADLLFEITI